MANQPVPASSGDVPRGSLVYMMGNTQYVLPPGPDRAVLACLCDDPSGSRRKLGVALRSSRRERRHPAPAAS